MGNVSKDQVLPQHMKIATCCYCGTRAALVLNQVRHELACGACGAPLHDMKMMPQRDKHPVKSSTPAASRRTSPAKPAKKRDYDAFEAPRSYKRKKPKKRRKSFGKKVFEELWDVVEDIFD
ncbi:hypothetical protein [Roseovarius sp. 2305UL8-3]|uniref:hypothetical protein n=1 Tax=Roseovarius conchicola TaxID=3121636 RepID=UPI0035283073